MFGRDVAETLVTDFFGGVVKVDVVDTEKVEREVEQVGVNMEVGVDVETKASANANANAETETEIEEEQVEVETETEVEVEVQGSERATRTPESEWQQSKWGAAGIVCALVLWAVSR